MTRLMNTPPHNLILPPDEQKILEKLLAQLRLVVRYDSAAIFLREGNCLVLVAGTDLVKPQIGSRLSLTSNSPSVKTFERKEVTIIADIQANPRWQWVWEGFEYVRGWMCVPLLRDDEAIGILTINSFCVDAYCQTQVKLVQTFADRVVTTIVLPDLAEIEHC